VTLQDIDAFVEQMHQHTLKPTTIKRRVSALKVYFDFLADTTGQLNHANPVRLKRHATKLGRHLPRDLTNAEVTRLLEVLDSPRDRALIFLMLRAGLRVSEAVTLTLDALFPAPTPGAPARLRVLGKGQKERIVYLSPETTAALQDWLRQRPRTSATRLLLNQHAQPLSTDGVQWLCRRYGERIGIHLTPHRLRHTFARQLTEAQMPIESLARLMGHAQISTTQIYLAGADPALRDTFDQAMRQLEAPSPPGGSAEQRVAPTAAPPVAVAHPIEPHYAVLPEWDMWACDLPARIREACWGYIQRHQAGWRPSQRRSRALHVSAEFARLFRFVLQRRTFTTVPELTRADLQAYVDTLVARGLKPKAVRAALTRVLGLLHELEEQGEPIAPSLFRVEQPRLPDPVPRALSEREIQTLEIAARGWLSDATPATTLDAVCFFLLAHAGLRASELLDLRQAEVDLAQRRLCVRRGKGDRDRVVYVSEIAAQALRQYLTLCPHPQHALEFMDEGERPLTYGWLYARACAWGEAAHVSHLTPHRLRHTFATRLINAGVPITSLQKLLGHDHLSTTQIYARVYDATVERDYRQAMERIQGANTIALSAEWFQRPVPVLLPVETVSNRT
jgi:site-specific recombinase XerD